MIARPKFGRWFDELTARQLAERIERHRAARRHLPSRIWIDDDGYVSPSEDPGFGVAVDDDAVDRHTV